MYYSNYFAMVDNYNLVRFVQCPCVEVDSCPFILHLMSKISTVSGVVEVVNMIFAKYALSLQVDKHTDRNRIVQYLYASVDNITPSH